MVTNGALPGEMLASIGGGLQLELGAALSWPQVVADVQATYGWTPTLSPGASAYRTLAQQETLFRQRFTIIPLAGRPSKVWNGLTWWLRPGMAMAATPGTSNHGKGLALDVGYLGEFDSARYREFALVANRRGWTNTEGRSIGEPWHWVKTNPDATPTPTPAPIEEDDMTPEQDRMLRALFYATGADGAEGGIPVGSTALGRLAAVQASTNGVPDVLAATREEIASVKRDTSGVPGVLAAARAEIAAIPPAVWTAPLTADDGTGPQTHTAANWLTVMAFRIRDLWNRK